MKNVGHRLAAAVDWLSHFSGLVAALCIVAAAFIVTEGVLARKLFGLSTIWQIEASVFLLIFAVFVGAAFVQKNDHHLNVDLLLVHLPPRGRAVVLIVVSALSCLLAGILAWYAWPMWWEAYQGNERSESLWSPSLSIPYFFLPFGMTLLFLQYINYIRKQVRALRTGDVDQEVVRAELKGIEVPESRPQAGREP